MKRKIIFLVALILVCCSLFPAQVMADAREEAVDFHITINPDGSADFIETHTIEFSDSRDYTVYGRIYLYPEGRSYRNWAVSVDGKTWRQLPNADEDNRPDGSFAVEYNAEGAVVTMYHRTNNANRAFTLSYRVENAVNIYDDTAEFFWDLSSRNEISTIGEMTAKVILPEGLTADHFRIWAHGPLNGTFTKDGGNSASLLVEYVDTYNPVDVRIAMPVEAFSGGYLIGGNFLQNILDEEQGLADKANAEREEYERQQAEYIRQQEKWRRSHPAQAWINDQEGLNTAVFFISLYGVIPFAFIYVFISQLANKRKINKMRHKSEVTPRYYRSLPDKRPPALVGYLSEYYSSGKDYGNYYTSTLMDMSLKGHIAMRASGKDTYIELKESAVPLLPHEEIIYGMLVYAGDGYPVSLKQFQKKINRQPDWAIAERNKFNSAVKEQFKENVSTEDYTKKRTFKNTLTTLLILGVIGFILLGPFLAAYFDLYWTFGQRILAKLIGFGIGVLWGIVISGINSSKKIILLSAKDEESLTLWQAFGRFLDDFTLFDEKDLPEFTVWKDYLTYAVALGKGTKLIKELALRYPSVMNDLGQDGTYFAVLCHSGHLNSSLFRSMDSIQKTTYRAGSGTVSSGSGGGGGFSSGGGGGGSGSGGGFAR